MTSSITVIRGSLKPGQDPPRRPRAQQVSASLISRGHLHCATHRNLVRLAEWLWRQGPELAEALLEQDDLFGPCEEGGPVWHHRLCTAIERVCK